MNIYRKSIVFFLLLSLSLATVYAVPAYPGLVRMKQPDGKELSLYIRGDEKIRWMESTDGYTLLYDKDQYIVFATLDSNKDMVPSALVAEDQTLRSSDQSEELKKIPKNLFYSDKQVQIFHEIENIKTDALKAAAESGGLKSTVGTAYAICALVDFPDKEMTKTKENFEFLLNQTGYNLNGARGSVSDFYHENSYGQLKLIINVVGPFRAQNNMAYYGDNNNSSGSDKNPGKLAEEVARFAFQNLSEEELQRYDNDGDKKIDTFHFIYAGYGEEAGGAPSTIWAHKSTVSLNFNGYRLNDYSCSPELRSNSGTNITHIGVICHELCHIFGAPDFYDTNGQTGGEYLGTGKWDLMANGSWNGSPSQPGNSPAHINMYQKIQFGWVKPDTLNAPRMVTEMPNSAENPEAYLYQTQTAGEYFVLENRQKKGFDAYTPGTGLLIYRVSIRNSDIIYNRVNNTHPQRVYPICASASYKIPANTATTYGSINTSGCPFPGSGKRSEFTDWSIPAALSWEQTESQKPLTGIREENQTISFQFMKDNAELKLMSNVEYLENGKARLSLSWQAPISEKHIIEYKVYRDDQLLQTTNQTVFRETLSESGIYKYQVSVVYEGGHESEKTATEVNIQITSLEEIPFEAFSENAEFFLYSIQGQLITRQKSKDFLFSNPSGLKPGVYILQVKDQGKISTSKWIIR